MGNFNLLKSKTFWFTLAGAAFHVAQAWNTPQRGQAIGEAVTALGAVSSLRGAVAKNGEGK